MVLVDTIPFLLSRPMVGRIGVSRVGSGTPGFGERLGGSGLP